MITTVDKGKFWAGSDGVDIWFEDGTKRKANTSDFIFVAGKYEGSLLSEVSDTWYLGFIMSKNPDDHLIQKTFKKRLGELE